jgi:hypothetical protein
MKNTRGDMKLTEKEFKLSDLILITTSMKEKYREEKKTRS